MRSIHRWLGLSAGTLALLLGITGAILALDPVRDASRAVSVPADLTVANLAARVAATIPGVEEMRRLPSGEIIVHSFDNGTARAVQIDPSDGRVLGEYRPSELSRWVKNLHRSLLLGDAGRIGTAGVALAMLMLAVSGLVLTVRRLGGWQRLAGRVRGTLMQRIHVVTGRVVVVLLVLSSATALYMSAATFGLVAVDADREPDVVSVPGPQADLSASAVPLLQALRVGDLERLSFPAAQDPTDTWKVVTGAGQGWMDRRSGQTLAWEDALLAQRVHAWVMVLHTGEGAWAWALVLGIMGASLPLFWISGLMMWRQGRRRSPQMTDNSPLRHADVAIYVASESGTTWGFAKALQHALVRNGHRVHAAGLEHFQSGPHVRHLFVLAATYGEGQPPAHAAQALTRMAREPVGAATATVLGFGDRQFTAFCAYAEAIEEALRARGWRSLLPMERIHQQCAQEFTRWGEALAGALREPLALDYVPRLPATTPLTLVSRQDHPGGSGEPAAVMRFALPAHGMLERFLGRGLGDFEAGDLLGILAPGSAVPRSYSLASGSRDGFVEICVRRVPGGLCSGFLHALQPGDRIAAFIEPNPGFVLERTRQPVVLIGAGTGVAPLAGFIRGNRRRAPMHLYYGARDPAIDFFFREEMAHWLGDQRLTSLQTTFSRTPGGGGHVQDALHRDAVRLRDLVAKGAILRVCGSQAMARGVAEALDGILQATRSSVRQLKAGGRYAEDVF